MSEEKMKIDFVESKAKDWLEHIGMPPYKNMCKAFVEILLEEAECFGCRDTVSLEDFAFLSQAENHAHGFWHYLAINNILPEEEVKNIVISFFESAEIMTKAIVRVFEKVDIKVKAQDETIKHLMDALIATGKEALEDGKGI